MIKYRHAVAPCRHGGLVRLAGDRSANCFTLGRAGSGLLGLGRTWLGWAGLDWVGSGRVGMGFSGIHALTPKHARVHALARVCVRTCVRASVRACVRPCACGHTWAHACVFPVLYGSGEILMRDFLFSSLFS